jgi:hypothetical protein
MSAPGLGVRDRGTGEHLEGDVVDDAAVLVERAAVAVRGVLAHAHVGDDVVLGIVRLDGADRQLDDAVLGKRAAPCLVLGLGQAEEDDRRDAERLQLVDLGGQLVERELEDARHRRDLVAQAGARLHEQRVDEVCGIQCGLADHRTKRLGAPQAPRAICGELHVTLLLHELVDGDGLVGCGSGRGRQNRPPAFAPVWKSTQRLRSVTAQSAATIIASQYASWIIGPA